VQGVFQRNSCLACHSASIYQVNGGGLNLETGDVGLRMLDAPSASGGTACQNERLIDDSAPQNSLILKLINQTKYAALNATSCQRQPMPQTGAFMSADDFACVASWVTEVANSQTPIPELDVEPFSPNSGVTALAKAKYVLHGGAPTAAELTAVGASSGTFDEVAMRNLIISWESTPEYQTKIEDFLALNLQQLPYGSSRYEVQLNSITKTGVAKIDAVALRSNLEESFVRTAWGIVDNNEDFRKVVTSREWYVTTALMAALVYLDKPNQPETRSYRQDPTLGNFFAETAYLEPSDYSDWRKVTLMQSDVPAVWENTSEFTLQLRSIPENGELLLRYPRVGFFSSPVFLNTWETNDDNDFRLTMSQTLIVALNKTLSPGDATAHITENGIADEHADSTSVCYQCHRHLDPLRLVFSNVLVSRYRAKTPITTVETRPSFSFYGVTQNFNTVDEFASILATHPEMPIGWVQKLCVWGNSSRCDETDPEFLRLVDEFRNNGYNLRLLVREYFSSPLFTGIRSTQTHETQEYLVSMSRGNHFCRAFDARAKQINQAAGTSGSVQLCNKGIVGLVPNDTYSRGEADLVQGIRRGWFDAKSIDSQCARVSYGAFPTGTAGLFSLDSPVADTLAIMTQYLIGLPDNHPRYADTLTALTRTYDMTTKPANCVDPTLQTDAVTCGYGLSKRDGLRAAWFSACTSPDFVGVGM
jgi:hypothetical protein